MTDIVIVAAARTAVGKFVARGQDRCAELGAIVIKALLERSGLAASRSARSSSAGARRRLGQNPARQAVIAPACRKPCRR